jgi:hypothetical protein
MNNLFRFGPVFLGAALWLPFIFKETIGEALDFFVFTEWAWPINHIVGIWIKGFRLLTPQLLPRRFCQSGPFALPGHGSVVDVKKLAGFLWWQVSDT